MRIQVTKNYSLFHPLEGNRPIVRRHVNSLVESIKKANLLPSNPIIVNETYAIIDGQHRIEAARQLGIEIYYIILDKSKLTEVHLLNENMKKWSAQDYIDSYASLGNQDYVDLKNFIITFGLPAGVSLELLTDYVKTGSRYHSAFKQGKWKRGNIKFAEKVALNVKKFTPYCDPGLATTTTFVTAVKIMTRNTKIDVNELVRKLNASGDKLHRQTASKLYLRVLEEIYNKYKHTTIRFF